ncbi:MAG: class I SAM-dependent methyltransferase [Novosphingobium sp.]|nr:class I SAM-dependent methyltransferase [Novosphingobium sp.]
MVLARSLARQLARPRGIAGRLLGGAMDKANRRPTELALDLLSPRDGEAILDAGCGTGAAMAGAIERADVHVTGLDPSAEMIAAARRRLSGWRWAELDQAPIEDMPFADESFDGILLLNVLYFSGPDGDMIANLHRVLKPGGRLVVYVTHRDTMERWPFARAGYHRLFDAPKLFGVIRQGGFCADRISVREVPIARSVRGLLARATR